MRARRPAERQPHGGDAASCGARALTRLPRGLVRSRCARHAAARRGVATLGAVTVARDGTRENYLCEHWTAKTVWRPIALRAHVQNARRARTPVAR